MIQDHPLSFADVISPVPLPTFLDEIWDRRQLVLSRNNPSFYGSLFTFEDVDRLLFLARNRPQELLTTVPRVKTAGGSEMRRRIDQVTTKELYKSYQAGDTIRISEIQSSWPPLLPLIRSISRILSVRLDVNVYLTPANSQGFPTHVDHEDVFILQVGGSKEWFIYEANPRWPLEGLSYVSRQGGFATPRRDETTLRLCEHVILETGDFLYIPRGYPHQATTSGQPSLHLTIGLHPVYWLDLVRAALEIACEEEPALRRALPPNFAHPEAREVMATQFASVARDLPDKLFFERALDALISARVASPGFPPDGHFAALANLETLRLESILEHRDGLDCRVVRTETDVAVHFGQERIQGPLSIGPALEYIQMHRSFAVSQLPGPLDDNSRLVLARRMVREGLLRIASL